MFRLSPRPCRLKFLLGPTLILVIGNNLINVPVYPPGLPASPSESAFIKPSAPADYSGAGKNPRRDSPTSMTTTPAHGQTTRARAVEAYGNLPLSFEANQGQADPQIKFLSRGGGYGLFLSETEATFYLSQPSGGRALDDSLDSREAVSDQTSPTPASVVRMKFLGSNPTPRLKGRDELDGRSNYFIGNDPEGWRTDIPTYAGVEYSNVYPGVDVVYRGDRRRLEYDFVVAPGTNPGVIKLAFKGVKNTRVDASGDLVLQTAGGEIRQRKPVIYQEAGGVKQYVEGRYLLKGRNEVGFEVGKYDAGRPLVIDPILVYSSYLGGGGNDFG